MEKPKPARCVHSYKRQSYGLWNVLFSCPKGYWVLKNGMRTIRVSESDCKDCKSFKEDGMIE